MKIQELHKTEERKEIHNSKANTKYNNMTEVEKIKLRKYDLECKESWTFI